MSERNKIAVNKNQSKNTRLPVNKDFANFRFNRDEMAHVNRYLMACERLMEISKKLKRPIKILDIGCGDIYIARTFQASFIVKKTDFIQSYTGLDIDDISLKRTAEGFPKSFNINLVCADVTDGGLKQFKNNEFDLVICLETIEHIQPKFVQGLLSEIKRIGRLYILSTPNFDGGTGRIPEDHVKEWHYNELKELILEEGFVIEHEIGVFSNLGKVKKYLKGTDKEKLFKYFESRFDADFLSIVAARIVPPSKAQNILRYCR